MASYTAEGGGGYSAAMALKDAFTKAGIESGVTVGGLWVMLEPEQIANAQSIAEEHQWKISGGATSSMLMAMESMSQKDGDWSSTIEMHQKGRDSHAIIQEFDV